ncbi:hypothetical protein D9M72_506390 [compost metagenome]
MGLGIADQVIHAFQRGIVCHQQHVGVRVEQADQREILERLVGGRLLHQRRHGQGRAADEEQGVAVRACLGGLGRGNGAASAGPVVDHDWLPQHMAQMLGIDPRRTVDRPAGRIAHDELDGARRVIVRSSGQAGQRAQHAGDDPSLHACLLGCAAWVAASLVSVVAFDRGAWASPRRAVPSGPGSGPARNRPHGPASIWVRSTTRSPARAPVALPCA